MRYDRIGESTEAALRVLVEKIGLTDVEVEALNLTKQDRATYYNSKWESSYEKACHACFWHNPVSLCRVHCFPNPNSIA